MPESESSSQKLTGRLHQVHYIPVYDVNKRREKRRREPATDWFDYLVSCSIARDYVNRVLFLSRTSLLRQLDNVDMLAQITHANKTSVQTGPA